MLSTGYVSPFGNRYGSDRMTYLFSEGNRIVLWRSLWYQLAKIEMELGLPITKEQVDEMGSKLFDADIDRAKEIEKVTKHDVVAHIRHYAEQCPKAAPIIHLGATSCFVTDNADAILMKDAVEILEDKLQKLCTSISSLAWETKGIITLSYTHFQPAQPTTMGKRASMWLQDVVIDMENLSYQKGRIKMLGCKGATGTADSFLELFDNNKEKVKELDRRLSEACNMDVFPISGQTYTRKQDSYVMQVLSGIAQTASKIATDIRLLSGLGEVHEPFGSGQVGSSAMPYKRNPIMCEKVCALSRFVICGSQNAAITAATQWLERTLDDSANRRVMIPEMFMATDEILDTLISVMEGLVVDDAEMWRHTGLQYDHVFMERVLMDSVKAGGDRQKLHEKLNRYSGMYSGSELQSKILADPDFNTTNIHSLLDMSGLAEDQVEEYVYQRH